MKPESLLCNHIRHIRQKPPEMNFMLNVTTYSGLAQPLSSFRILARGLFGMGCSHLYHMRDTWKIAVTKSAYSTLFPSGSAPESISFSLPLSLPLRPKRLATPRPSPVCRAARFGWGNLVSCGEGWKV